MKLNEQAMRLITRCLFLVSIIGMVSCRGGLVEYRGRTVDPDRRIELLENGPRKGTWHTFDLTINYQYEINTDILRLSGVTELSRHYQSGYKALRHFFLTLFFLDDAGKVQESHLILNASASSLDDRVAFDKSLEIPINASFMAFHYMLGVQEGRRMG